MALECYADAADYQALYGDDLTGAALDNALCRPAATPTGWRWDASRLPAGWAGLNDRCAELVTQAVCRQAHWASGDGAAWRQGTEAV